MTLKKALEVFKEKYPDKKIKGYWIIDDEYVICTDSKTAALFRESALFVVHNDGTVIPTNPTRHNVTQKPFTNL